MEILVATHNLHKKEEIQQILGEKYHITSLTDYHIHDEIIEDGNSFQWKRFDLFCLQGFRKLRFRRRFSIGSSGSRWKTESILHVMWIMIW